MDVASPQYLDTVTALIDAFDNNEDVDDEDPELPKHEPAWHLAGFPVPTNGKRAERGGVLAARWAEHAGEKCDTTEELLTAAQDAISDLLHYVHSQKGEPLIALRLAKSNFVAEANLEPS
jgi:hypothetical protein